MEETKTIGKDYNLTHLAKFCLPAVLNELVISLLFTIDDALFVSRFVGANALAAFSILMPLFMLHNSPANLLGGVSILCSRKMGEGKHEEARGDFTAIVLLTLGIGIVLGVLERVFMNPIIRFLGATDIIFPYARDFVKVGAYYVPLTLVSSIFMRFFVPAGKPKMELLATIINVSANIFFDWYFVVYKGIGMVGTAYANLIATIIMCIIGVLFFSSEKCEIRFGKPSKNLWKLVKDSCKYGISSFLSNTTVAISSLVSNYSVLHFGSEAYLAAFTIVNNITFVFMGCFFGLFGSVSPIISYAVGEKNVDKLHRTFRQTFILTSALTVILILSYILFGDLVADLFIAESARDSKDIINYGMKIATWNFLLFGYNVGARILFAAVGNHKISATLTFLQEVVFSSITIVVLPMLFGVDGVWFSFIMTNVLTLFITITAVYLNRDNYGYGSDKTALLIK